MPDYLVDIVLFQTDGKWIAQGLQFDIGAEGDSVDNVLYEFQRAFIGYLAICHEHKVEPFADLGAAPQRYWDLWKNAEPHEADSGAAFRVGQSVVPPVSYLGVRVAAEAA